MRLDELLKKYNELKKEFTTQSACSDNITNILKDIFELSYDFLLTCSKLTLKSQVTGKEYFSFQESKQRKFSRPVNCQLFLSDKKPINKFWDNLKDNSIAKQTPREITQVCYTIAISFCCCIDILKNSDQKTPGTFFEYFIGHLYSVHFEMEPHKQLEVLNLDMKSKLPTDFIFDLGKDLPKFHIPVKTSTRERVVQVWAHQRVLDGVYGTGRFLGLLSCLSETKLDHKKLEVIEICLPDQWRIYQLFIAQLKRVYYLDVPNRYADLNSVYPKIHVKEFGEFFHETKDLMN